jgi:hypothetical protein
MKLYKVNLRGMTFSATGTVYGVSYVVAEDSEKAYQKVRKFLDKNDLGFSKDRELDSVELIAEDSQYTDTRTMLYL